MISGQGIVRAGIPAGLGLLKVVDQGWIEKGSLGIVRILTEWLGEIGSFFQLNVLRIHFLRFVLLILIILR